MACGSLVLPRDLAVGARIQARDPEGFWYNAKVISKKGTGARASVIVHYTGFGKSKGAQERFTERKAPRRKHVLGS